MPLDLDFLSPERRMGSRRLSMAMLFEALADLMRENEENEKHGNIEPDRSERVHVDLPWTPLGG